MKKILSISLGILGVLFLSGCQFMGYEINKVKNNSRNILNRDNNTKISEEDFLKASRNGDKNLVQKYIENGGNLLALDEHGYSSVMLASMYNNNDVLKLLLRDSNNFDLSKKSIYGENALDLVINNSNVNSEILKILASNASNTTILNTIKTKLSKCTDKCNKNNYLVLVDNTKSSNWRDINTVPYRQENIIRRISKYGNLDLIKAFKKKYGVSFFNVLLDKDNKSSLIRATEGGNISIIKYLIENGAKINYWSGMKYPPIENVLTIAAEKGYTDIIKYFIKLGVSPNMRNLYGETALMKASEGGYKEIVNILLKNGANPNLISFYSKENALVLSPIFQYNEKSKDIAKLLIENGANVNFQRDNGGTILMDQIYSSNLANIDGIKFLLDNGADPHIKNNEGESAFSKTKKLGNNEVIELLKKY